MIDYIKNGVTTGGFAPNVLPDPQGANIYNQYMEALWKERNEAQNKNYELLKDVDLGKVDPRDRGAVQGMYDKWKNYALQPPNTTNRRDITAWRQNVMQGETELKNKIGEVMSARQKLVEGFNQNRDKLTPKGLQQWNDAFNKPVVDDSGNVIYHNANEFEHAPEQVFDVGGKLKGMLKESQTPEKTQIGYYKNHEGKVIKQMAKITNVNQYLNNAVDEYHNNPKFAYEADRQYKNFMDKNPDSKLSQEDFIREMAKSHLPQQTDWDKGRLKNIKTTPGLQYNDVDEVVPNDYKVTVNGPAKTYAEQQQANLANYNAMMQQAKDAAKSGDPNALDRAGRLFSPVVFGKSFDGDGKENRVQFVKGPDGKVVMKATGTNVWGIPTDKGLDMSDPNTWKTLHDSYNNQFTKPTNLKYRIPADQLNPYTKDLSAPDPNANVLPISEMPFMQEGGGVPEQPLAGAPNPTPSAGNPSTSMMDLGQPQPKQSTTSKVKQALNKGLNSLFGQ